MSAFDHTVPAIIFLVFALAGKCAMAAAPPEGAAVTDAKTCSHWLAIHKDAARTEQYRGCVVAVASTYIDAEENSQPPEDQLFAEDVSRHRVGAEPSFAPGNKAKLMVENSHTVIAAIRNRRWTVEGDTAWILYDGYLKKDPDTIGFYVAERITLDKGLIKEILVADITVPK